VGLIKKQGAFYSYGDVRLGQGRENAKDFIHEHQQLAKELEDKLHATSVPQSLLKEEPLADQ
jgi:recombination protein RecA